MAQLIVVVEVLVAERQAEHPLPHHGLDAVLDMLGRTLIPEAGGKARHDIDRPIGRAEQQAAGIGGDQTAVERRHHGAALDACKTEQIRATLCLHRGILLSRPKSLLHNNFRRFGAPMHLLSVRYPG